MDSEIRYRGILKERKCEQHTQGVGTALYCKPLSMCTDYILMLGQTEDHHMTGQYITPLNFDTQTYQTLLMNRCSVHMHPAYGTIWYMGEGADAPCENNRTSTCIDLECGLQKDVFKFPFTSICIDLECSLQKDVFKFPITSICIDLECGLQKDVFKFPFTSICTDLECGLQKDVFKFPFTSTCTDLECGLQKDAFKFP